MCTSISWKTKNNFYFGRNLDLDYSLDYKIIITPREYKLNFKFLGNFTHDYSIIGMGINVGDYPLYFDAMNEKGLSIAGLNFPHFAKYHKKIDSKTNICPFEIIPFILGQCASINEVKKVLNNTNIVNQSFSKSLPNAPLHWIVSDKNDDSIVIESTERGLCIYDNQFGVLSNSPTFDFHCYNMSNYKHLSSKDNKNNLNNKLDLFSFSEGAGGFGLPGDLSSSSRFIRATFNKFSCIESSDNNENIVQFFHLLGSVQMIKGTVITENNNYELTQYSSCISYKDLTYYYKTYNNDEINAVKLKKEYVNRNELTIFDLEKKLQINFLN